MNRTRLADAFDALAEAAATVSIELRASEQPGPEGASPPSQGSSAPAPRSYEPQGGFTKCPAHAKEWKPSKFPDGPGYCTAQSDDPEWSRNGYCSVTERSAAAWVRKHPPQVAA